MSQVTAAPAEAGSNGADPVVRAVARARAAFDSGRTRPLAWRRGQLAAVERLLAEREDELVDALARDLGRPAVDAWLGDVASVAAEARYARRHLALWARRRFTGVPLGIQPAIGSHKPEPLGVVAVVGPWNYPFYLTLTPIVTALAAGNTVVLKPSEFAPATAEALERLLPRYLDPDAVVVVQGGPEETQRLVGGDVDHVFFTGSPEVGAKVMETAARNLTPVTLELGGKCPVIVDESADLGVAARRIAWTKLLNSGQTCIAPDYVLAHRAVLDDLVSELQTAFDEMGRRDGMPIVNTRHAGRIAGMLEDHGGRVVRGGGSDAEGSSVELTIVVDPDADSRLMQEEIFGPVLPIVPVDSVDAAIARVKSGPKPLATYVFARSAAARRTVREQVATGGVVENHALFHVLVPQLPFGGVGNSGMGAYHGKWGFETLSHRKPVLHRPTHPDPRLVYPPYSETVAKLLRKVF